MEIILKNASMSKDAETGYVGKVQIEVKSHKELYEITLHSKRGKEWGYALNFLNRPGPDEEIDQLDEYLDENDEAFEQIVLAARSAISD